MDSKTLVKPLVVVQDQPATYSSLSLVERSAVEEARAHSEVVDEADRCVEILSKWPSASASWKLVSALRERSTSPPWWTATPALEVG